MIATSMAFETLSNLAENYLKQKNIEILNGFDKDLNRLVRNFNRLLDLVTENYDQIKIDKNYKDFKKIMINLQRLILKVEDLQITLEL